VSISEEYKCDSYMRGLVHGAVIVIIVYTFISVALPVLLKMLLHESSESSVSTSSEPTVSPEPKPLTALQILQKDPAKYCENGGKPIGASSTYESFVGLYCIEGTDLVKYTYSRQDGDVLQFENSTREEILPPEQLQSGSWCRAGYQLIGWSSRDLVSTIYTDTWCLGRHDLLKVSYVNYRSHDLTTDTWTPGETKERSRQELDYLLVTF